MKNTLNICIGHLPFPKGGNQYIDLMLTPNLVEGSHSIAIIPDSIYGPHGNTLSEYAQLIWLNKSLHNIESKFEYIRIFHYRRFVSETPPNKGEKSKNLPWATVINKEDVELFENCFSRQSNKEIYNSPVEFKNGVLGQYGEAHCIDDILNFTIFLLKAGIFTTQDAAEFLKQTILIPSPNIGVFHVSTYKLLFNILEAASDFLHSPLFTLRSGYQRRSTGFLLERLNSFLIMKIIEVDPNRGKFGHNMIIAESPIISHTE